MKSFWDQNGFLVINNFYSEYECDELRNRADKLVKNFDPSFNKSIFNTKKQEHVDDNYFLLVQDCNLQNSLCHNQ